MEQRNNEIFSKIKSITNFEETEQIEDIKNMNGELINDVKEIMIRCNTVTSNKGDSD